MDRAFSACHPEILPFSGEVLCADNRCSNIMGMLRDSSWTIEWMPVKNEVV